jgi:hypothetical protein
MAHTSQRERFDRRLAMLLEYRQAERQAVRDLEQAANGTHEEFLIAESIHRTWLDIVKRAAAELATVYFED